MIIAECGQNHMGDMALAKDLIRLAQQNGADLVKFQLYDHKMLYGDNPSLPDVALSFDQAYMLCQYGALQDIEVFFSVFDTERVKWCEHIGVKRYKLAFGYGTPMHLALIKAIDLTGKPIFISDNPSILMRVLPNRSKVKWLYCIPNYPTLPEDLLLGRVNFEYQSNTLNNICYAGLSDHTIGIDIAKIALARGARIIEKHFALDHETGIDAEWSMTPKEMKELKQFENICKEIL